MASLVSKAEAERHVGAMSVRTLSTMLPLEIHSITSRSFLI